MRTVRYPHALRMEIQLHAVIPRSLLVVLAAVVAAVEESLDRGLVATAATLVPQVMLAISTQRLAPVFNQTFR